MPADTTIAPTTPAPSTDGAPAVDATPTREMKVEMAPATVPATPRPSPMVAVKDALHKAAEKHAAKSASKPAAAEKPAAEQTPAPPTETPPEPEKTQDEPPAAQDKPAEEPAKPADEKKLGPWQLKEKWEKTAKTYEREVTELRQKLASLGEVETHKTRADKAEARAKELEEAIRFVDYSKSEEFRDKYQKPYEQAWERAKVDLAQLTVALPDGQERVATPQDMLRLAQLPLGEARRAAKELFGDSADDIMAHYRSIRDTYEAQVRALDTAKKDGTAREQQLAESRQRIASESQQLWQESLRSFAEEDEYLRPKEGDDKWNELLDESTLAIDSAFEQDANNPQLTRDERAAIVKKHAAIRSQAIAYAPLKLENERLKAEIADRDAKLAAYKKAEPGASDGAADRNVKAQPADPMERFRQAAFAAASKNR